MDNSKTLFLETYLEKTLPNTIENLPFSYKSITSASGELFINDQTRATKPSVESPVENLYVLLCSYRSETDVIKALQQRQRDFSADLHLLLLGLLSSDSHREYQEQRDFWENLSSDLKKTGWQHLVMQHLPLKFYYSGLESYQEDYLYFSRNKTEKIDSFVKEEHLSLVTVYAQGFDKKVFSTDIIKSSVK